MLTTVLQVKEETKRKYKTTWLRRLSSFMPSVSLQGVPENAHDTWSFFPVVPSRVGNQESGWLATRAVKQWRSQVRQARSRHVLFVDVFANAYERVLRSCCCRKTCGPRERLSFGKTSISSVAYSSISRLKKYLDTFIEGLSLTTYVRDRSHVILEGLMIWVCI